MKASRAIIRQNKLLEEIVKRLDVLQADVDTLKPKVRTKPKPKPNPKSYSVSSDELLFEKEVT